MFGSRFGNSQPFGSTANAGGAFGAAGSNANNTMQSGFSGFGAANTNSGNAFSASPALNSPFGANPPQQATGNNAGLFGMASNTNNSANATGNPSGTLFGMNNNSAGGAMSIGMGGNANSGTAVKPFQPVEEKDPTTNVMNVYQSITFMNEYRNSSFEELRFQDYQAGRKFGNSTAAAGNTFGAPQSAGSTFGMNNQNTNNAFQSNPFGQKPASAGGFGGTLGNNNGLFGSNTNSGNNFGGAQNPTNNAFGATNSSGGLFGNNAANNTSGGGLFGNKFGANNTNATGPSSGLFGQSQPQASPFGSSNTFNKPPAQSGGLFGQSNTANPFSTNSSQGAFGQNNQQQRPGGLFGQNNPSGAFGQNNQQQGQTGLFGQQNSANNNSLFGNKTQSGGLFGQSNATSGFNSTGGLFGQNNQSTQQSGGLFGQNNQTQANGLFGQNNQAQQNNFSQPVQGQSSGLFGQNNQTSQQQGGLFGNKPAGTSGGLFAGNNSNQGGLFGQNQPQTQPSTGLFGQSNQQQNTSGGLFGSKPSTGFGASNSNGGLFGNNAQSSNQTAGGLFGNKPPGSGFGTNSTASGGSMFGNNTNTGNQTGGLFGGSNQSTLGNQSGGLFSKPAQGSSFGSQNSGGLFGSKPVGQTTGSSLFGNNNANNNNSNNTSTGGLFGSQQQPNSQSLLSNPAGSLNNGNLQLQQQTQEQQLLISNPYGTNDLFSKVQQTTPPTQLNINIQVSATKIEADNKKKTDLVTAYKQTPKPLFTANAKQISSHNWNKDSTEITIVKEPLDVKVYSDIDNSFQKIGSKFFEPDTNLFKAMIKANGAAKKHQQKLENPSKDNELTNKPLIPGDTIAIGTGTSQNIIENVANATPNIKEKTPAVISKITPNNNGNEKDSSLAKKLNDISYVDEYYYISPSLETLCTCSPSELSNVRNLTVGHSKYGKVEFLEPVNLTGTPLGSICGDLVIFEPMSLLLYSNTTDKPAFGDGLNVKARVFCYDCYPLNKSTREPIKDPDHIIMKRHIERLKNTPNTQFESFDPHSGTYVFTVDHALA
ncbi:Uncharacterized protein RNJ44_04697 [Nakaseomyces bracarensis]|uniref:Peptidase S59 domain-containing protein n=1 Tax=Nakaseomyces bracarensis TaxID=273131 RepID=A0ABR4NVL9_9SACH